jgi:hypothetical protein
MFEENGGINCGYVMKPEFLMVDMTKQENVNKFRQKYQEVNLIIQIDIISAQILESHTENENEQAFPVIELSVHGQSSDQQMNRGMTTKIYPNNQFHPIYLETSIDEFALDVFEDSGALKKAKASESDINVSEKKNDEDEPKSVNSIGQGKKKKNKKLSNRYIVQLYYPELAFIVFKVKDARNWYTIKLGGFAAKNMRSGLRSIDLYDRQHANDGYSSLLVNLKVL